MSAVSAVVVLFLMARVCANPEAVSVVMIANCGCLNNGNLAWAGLFRDPPAAKSTESTCGGRDFCPARGPELMERSFGRQTGSMA